MIKETDIVLVCDHIPRNHWISFEPGEVKTQLENGAKQSADHLGMCDECFSRPIEELKFNVFRGPKEQL